MMTIVRNDDAVENATWELIHLKYILGHNITIHNVMIVIHYFSIFATDAYGDNTTTAKLRKTCPKRVIQRPHTLKLTSQWLSSTLYIRAGTNNDRDVDFLGGKPTFHARLHFYLLTIPLS